MLNTVLYILIMQGIIKILVSSARLFLELPNDTIAGKLANMLSNIEIVIRSVLYL